MDIRHRALEALAIGDPAARCAAVARLHEDMNALPAGVPAAFTSLRLEAGCEDSAVLEIPGRPPRPLLVQPGEVPHRSPFTPEGYAALIHAICHIEFNAINLALDAVWRFGGMPEAYYREWLGVAREEAFHFGLLRTHLQSLGHDYGDFVAHDGLWAMCEKTAGDVLARMALVPRTLEARGLDASPLIQARLRKVGTPAALEAVGILDVILRDEIGHVAVGNRWYGWLCARQGLDPLRHYRQLAREHAAPRPRPPFNHPARLAAGFTEPELDELRVAAAGT